MYTDCMYLPSNSHPKLIHFLNLTKTVQTPLHQP